MSEMQGYRSTDLLLSLIHLWSSGRDREIPALYTLASFHLHACFLSLVHRVTSGVTEASYWKPHVFSPAVKQEAALDSGLFLIESGILHWSTWTPHVAADMASHLHL